MNVVKYYNMCITQQYTIGEKLNIFHIYCQTPVLDLGLGVDFTFAGDNHNIENDNPHLNFQGRREKDQVLFFLTLSKNDQRLAPYSSKYFSESPQSPTEAAIGGPLRACRAKMAFLVEEAVPVQEAVGVGVVGEELTV